MGGWKKRGRRTRSLKQGVPARRNVQERYRLCCIRENSGSEKRKPSSMGDGGRVSTSKWSDAKKKRLKKFFFA